ncbi:unnamed protein product [Rhizoctonia solani]|uniref:Uncharacterized protein n=1 Tax=Rhizoctonia solani TaxID=456999 RepID=A0A8H3A237_9AGAM|nr:unnamed protein product [Rhizoctonia solani]
MATSLRDSVSRLYKAVTSFKMSSKNSGDKACDSPNTLIFPPVLDKHNRDWCSKLYSPKELLTRISEDAKAVDYIGKIHITEISYYKEIPLPEHEYLVFKVQAIDPLFVNYIKVDRCPKPRAETKQTEPAIGDTSSTQNVLPEGRRAGSVGLEGFYSSSLKDSSFSFGNRDAQDVFHVSDSRGLASLKGRKDLLLGTIKVSPGTGPTLEQLVVLAVFVSSYQPQYDLLSTQCYWYAHTIWMLLLTAFPKTVKFDGKLPGAGQNAITLTSKWHGQLFASQGCNYAVPISETEIYAQLAAEYLMTSWHTFEATIPALQAKHGAMAQRSLLQAAQAEAERAERERQQAQEDRQRVEEERNQAEEERKRAEERMQQAKEEMQQIQEEKRQADERARAAEETNRQLREMVAKLQANSSTTMQPPT